MKTAIYPGSFDPVTLGHLNIIKRAAACFDHLIVCVMINSKKQGMFTPQERVELLKRPRPIPQCGGGLLGGAAGRLCQAAARPCGGERPAGRVRL